MQRIEIKLINKNNGQIDGVPKNPRQWKKGEVEKLARSIEQTPELFDLRPIIVYDNVDGYVAIGGNMRLEAAKLLKWKDVPCEIVSRETPTAKLKEIVIKDNSAFGEWDMDELANQWDDLPLSEWGLPLGDWKAIEDEPKEVKEVEDGEDERIRQKLISFVENWKVYNPNSPFDEYPIYTSDKDEVDKMIAWLKKQGN